jgi:hypothetical protein
VSSYDKEVVMGDITMEEWVHNDMYQKLIQKPLWVLSAFGFLKDGDILRTGDVRLDLIRELVLESMDKCPPRFYDNDYRHNWSVGSYIPLVKQAVLTCRRIKLRYEIL